MVDGNILKSHGEQFARNLALGPPPGSAKPTRQGAEAGSFGVRQRAPP